MHKFMIVKTTVVCSKLIVACTFIILCCTVSIFHKISWLLWFQKYISQIYSPGVDGAKVLHEKEGYKKLLIDVQHAGCFCSSSNGNGNTIRGNFTAHAHYVFLRCCTVHVSVCVLAWDPLSLEASRIFNSLVPDHTTPTYARWKYGWLGSTLALFTPFRYGDVPVAMVITCVPSRRDFDLILQGVWQPSSLIP